MPGELSRAVHDLADGVGVGARGVELAARGLRSVRSICGVALSSGGGEVGVDAGAGTHV